VDNAQVEIKILKYVDLIVEHVSHDGNAVIMSIETSFQDVFQWLNYPNGNFTNWFFTWTTPFVNNICHPPFSFLCSTSFEHVSE